MKLDDCVNKHRKVKKRQFIDLGEIRRFSIDFFSLSDDDDNTAINRMNQYQFNGNIFD